MNLEPFLTDEQLILADVKRAEMDAVRGTTLQLMKAVATGQDVSIDIPHHLLANHAVVGAFYELTRIMAVADELNQTG